MSEEVVVSVKDLGKSYRIWRDPSARLKAPLYSALGKVIRPFSKRVASISSDSDGRVYNRTRYYQDFQALKGVDLTLRRGESIGIIGRNGSGKSTLLQMIAGTLTPSQGTVETKGRVAALLELGAGFNDEFTGRENVYMNGAILGLTTQQIDERFERIVEFANIGEFIDQPIKTYSSGMRVRLAFAVQAEVDPDILIVDEALAVGDIRFTMKCIRRMKDLIENGTTLIFVSHDLSSIVNFCKEVIWIHDGEIVNRGDPKAISLEYSNFMHYGTLSNGSDKPGVTESADQNEDDSVIDGGNLISSKDLFGEQLPDSVDSNIKWESLKNVPCDGNGGVSFLHAAMRSEEDHTKSKLFEGGEPLKIWLHVRANADIDSPIVCADIYDIKGNLISGHNTCFITTEIDPLSEGLEYVFEFGSTLPYLRNGEYTVVFGLSDGTYDDHTHICGVTDTLPFEVKSSWLSQKHHTVSMKSYTISCHGTK